MRHNGIETRLIDSLEDILSILTGFGDNLLPMYIFSLIIRNLDLLAK